MTDHIHPNTPDEEIVATVRDKYGKIQKSDLELEKVILFGGNSQGLSKYMPAFDKTFSNLEAKHLIKYIHKDLSGNQN